MKITYRGWCGHFILADRCLFRLNTLIEHNDIKVVVSTVGNLHSKDGAYEVIGVDRHYETACFRAMDDDQYLEIDAQKQLDYFDGFSIDDYKDRTDYDNIANEMHERIVSQVVEDIKTGKLKGGE